MHIKYNQIWITFKKRDIDLLVKSAVSDERNVYQQHAYKNQ